MAITVYKHQFSTNSHPITKTDWEGTGVRPDKLTDKDETLKQAYFEALDALIDNANHEQQKNRYNEIKVASNN